MAESSRIRASELAQGPTTADHETDGQHYFDCEKENDEEDDEEEQTGDTGADADIML